MHGVQCVLLTSLASAQARFSPTGTRHVTPTIWVVAACLSAQFPGTPERSIADLNARCYSTDCISAYPCSSAQFPGAPERSIEDLKARYYGVARQLLVGREGGPESVANNMLVRTQAVALSSDCAT